MVDHQAEDRQPQRGFPTAGGAARAQVALDEQAARVRAARPALAAALGAMPGTTVFESAGNFLLARFARGGDAVFQALKARNILVRNFSGAHPLLANCLRISIGSPDENAALLAALNEILIA